MRIQNSRWICIFLALFIFCAGLRMENSIIDIAFEDMCTAETNSYIISADNIYSDPQICAIEIIGEEEDAIAHRLGSQQESSEEEIDAVSGRLNSNYLTQLGGKIYISSEVIQVCDYYQEKLILNYIHKLDGKKRF